MARVPAEKVSTTDKASLKDLGKELKAVVFGQDLAIDALAAAIRGKMVAGAAIDVFDPEPPPAGYPLLGFDNVLLPSGYDLGIDSVAFAGGVAPMTDRIRLLVAVRCGELWPPQLARQLATLDQMLQGRLTINIISSDLPGAPIDGGPRYARSREVMTILRTLLFSLRLLHGERVVHSDIKLDNVMYKEPSPGCLNNFARPST